MDDKNNLLEKLGIVAKKEEVPTKRKVTPTNPRPTQAPATSPTLENKYSSDDLAIEYEQMLKERADMAKQIKDLEAKNAPVTPAPITTPTPVAVATPTPAPVTQVPSAVTTTSTPMPSTTTPTTPTTTVTTTPPPAVTTAKAPEPVKTVAPMPISQVAPAPAPKPSTPSDMPQSFYFHNAEDFNTVEDIYSAQGKDLNGVHTVYVVESFVDALPPSLTETVKRDVVMRILNVSNISADELVADGNARLNILSEYSKDFKEYTKDYVSARSSEVAILEDQIKALKKEIMDRNKLQAKQQAEIAAETAKISSNMIFITKEKTESTPVPVTE